MGLAHGDRELRFPAPVEFAEARVAVALRIALDVLVPQDRQRNVLALQLAMNGCPVGFDMTAMALLRPGVGKQPRLKHRIGHLLRQRPTKARSLEALKRRSHGRCRHANPTGDLTGRHATNELQPKNFAHLAHDRPLCWHPVLLWEPKEPT